MRRSTAKQKAEKEEFSDSQFNAAQFTTPLIELRPYQLRIVAKAVDNYVNKSVRSVLIDSPTGSGKTIVALMICRAMHELKGARIGWVAMRRNLLSQAEFENKRRGFHLPIKFISMFEKEPPTDLDMLVVDEAQHDVTSSMMHIHARIEPKWLCGCSATPWRADRVKLCFDTVIKDAGIAALIKDGYLAQYHHYTIPKWTPEFVTDRYLREPKRWGKSLIFFHRLAQCYKAKELLVEHGVACDVVTGATDVESQLKKFSDGSLQILINCMKLTEGLDVPDVKTVWARPSSKSVTIQMCGRVFRKHSDLPYKQIVQSEDTRYTFVKTALPVLQHILVDDGWRTLQVNPHIERVGMKTVCTLAKIEVTMPDYIKKMDAKHATGRHRTLRRDALRTNPFGTVAVSGFTPEEHVMLPRGEIIR